jgi:hypothetical protein
MLLSALACSSAYFGPAAPLTLRHSASLRAGAVVASVAGIQASSLAEAPSTPATPHPLQPPGWLTGVVLPSEAGAPPVVLDFIAGIQPVHFNLDIGSGGGLSGGRGSNGRGGRGGGDGDDGQGASAPGMAPREGEGALSWTERLYGQLQLCIKLLTLGLLASVAAAIAAAAAAAAAQQQQGVRRCRS